MSTLLIILLTIDAVLFVALVAYAVKKECDKTEDVVKCKCECEKTEEKEPVVEAPASAVEEATPVVEAPAPVVKKSAPVVETVAVSEDSDEEIEDSDKAKRIPFGEKILALEEKVHGFYDEINNKFKSMRKINTRISTKGVSYRLGRDLVAKLTIRGKTLRLHLALDISKFDEKIYFQKSMGDVKAYEEVPFTVKVRSDRALKNALKLIEALAEEKGIEYKTRFNRIDSIAQIKDIIVDNVISGK